MPESGVNENLFFSKIVKMKPTENVGNAILIYKKDEIIKKH